MGSSSQQTQSSQQSSTQPWAASQPTVTGILGQLNPLISSSGVNPTEAGAINQLTSNAAAGNPYAPQIGANATSLLSGGGANNQAGAVNSNYQNYYNQLNPLASNTNYDPTQTPGIGTELTALDNSITQQINGQFAGAERFGSGANAYALAQGLAAGEAPVLTAQYNANVANQQGAASNLYGAGNTTANTLSGYNQQAIANQQAGIQAASDALQAQNYGPTAMLAAQQLAQSIPARNLGLLAQIGIPIAGLGTQSNGSGTSSTTNNPSLLSDLQTAGGLFSTPANGTSAIGGLLSLISDRRLKHDICQVGALFDGTPVYRYRYNGENVFQIGLMAQDVELYAPQAVTTSADGNKSVEYRAATERAVFARGR